MKQQLPMVLEYNCQRQTQANTDQAASNSTAYDNVDGDGGKSIQEDNKDAWVTLA